MAFIYNYKWYQSPYSTECSSLEEAICLAASDLENGEAWPKSIFEDDKELWSSHGWFAVSESLSESLKAFSEANDITFPLCE